MSKLKRENNLTFIACSELQRLNIHSPSPEQLEAMKEMLADRVFVSGRLILHPALTNQEAVCLLWVTRGKSSLEISRILKLKRSTIRNYMARIKHKLQVNTLAQAVFEGIRYSYIQPKTVQPPPPPPS